MWEKIRVIFTIPELRRKIGLTLLLLFIFRLGGQVPLPMIDFLKMKAFFGQESQAGLGALFNQVAMFSASSLNQATIFGLGIMPYISASIIFQLLGSVYPPLEKLQKEGESGRKKINEYTRYATVVLCLGQSWMYMKFLTSNNLVYEQFLVGGALPVSWVFAGVLTMTAGTVFLMWLGEQIDEYGIGNGISLLIMAGILARMPFAIYEDLIKPIQDNGLELGWRRTRQRRRRNDPCVGRVVRGRGVRRRADYPRPAAHSDAKRQARARSKGLRRHAAVLAVAGESGRRDADHFRQQLVAVPVGVAPVSVLVVARPVVAVPPDGGTGVSSRRFVDVQHFVCRANLLLLLFLDGDLFQPEGHGRQPEELRHVHPRLSARATHGRLPRKSDGANYLRWRRVPCGGCHRPRPWFRRGLAFIPAMRAWQASTAAPVC